MRVVQYRPISTSCVSILHRPLLLRIKQAYDEALHDAAAAACDNAYLSNKMSMVPHKHVGTAGAGLTSVV